MAPALNHACVWRLISITLVYGACSQSQLYTLADFKLNGMFQILFYGGRCLPLGVAGSDETVVSPGIVTKLDDYRLDIGSRHNQSGKR